MVIGSLLIQPQKLRRAADQTPDAALVADAVAMISRLVANGAGVTPGTMAASIQGAIEAAGQRLQTRAQSGLAKGKQRITRWVDSLRGVFDGVAGISAGGGDALESVQRMLDQLAGKVESAADDRLRTVANELAGFLRDDLGLSEQVIEAELWATMEDAIARLDAAAAATPGRECENAKLLASVLRRMLARARGQVRMPRIDAARLSDLLIAKVNRTGWFIGARKAACVGHQASKALGAVDKILQAVPLDLGFRGPIMGAAAAPQPEPTYLWYTSWLLGDDYHIAADGKTIFKNWESVRTSETPMTAADVPALLAAQGKPHTFSKLKAEQIEEMARHTAWIEEMGKLPGHWVNGILTGSRPMLHFPLGTVHWLQGIFSLAKKQPLRWWTLDAIGWTKPVNLCCCCSCMVRLQNPVWAVIGPVGLTVLLQSLLWQAHFRSCGSGNYWMYWLTCILPDIYKTMTVSAVAGGLRDAALGIATLLNDKPGADSIASPFNVFSTSGVEGVLTGVLTMIFTGLIPREHYFMPFINGDQTWYFLLYMVLIAPAVTLLGIFVGTLLTQLAFCQRVDLSRLFKDQWCRLLLAMPLFAFSFIMGRAGDTDGGRYNPAGSPSYPGYADPSTSPSPYLLPYSKSAGAIYAVQVNLGLVSHQAPPLTGSDQVYAYDFSADERTPILASRAGTVVYIEEDVPNDSTNFPEGDPRATGNSTPNAIYVVHNIMPGGAPWAGGAVFNLLGATGGQFKLKYAGQETGNLAFNAAAAAIQTALEGLGSIGVGNVTVTGGAGSPFTVTFGGVLPPWLVNGVTIQNGTTALSGGTGTPTATLSPAPPHAHDVNPTTGVPAFTIARYLHGRQSSISTSLAATRAGLTAAQAQLNVIAAMGGAAAVVNLDGATSGQFRLTFNGTQTADIAVTATALQVQAALQAVLGGSFGVTGSAGGPYTVSTVNARATLAGGGLTVQDGTTPPSGGGGNETVTAAAAGAPMVVSGGETIMLCGDTGLSFNNHVHMDLRTYVSGASADSSGNQQINDSSFSVPFIFQDVKNIVGGPDGVPQATREYTSSQT